MLSSGGSRYWEHVWWISAISRLFGCIVVYQQQPTAFIPCCGINVFRHLQGFGYQAMFHFFAKRLPTLSFMDSSAARKLVWSFGWHQGYPICVWLWLSGVSASFSKYAVFGDTKVTWFYGICLSLVSNAPSFCKSYTNILFHHSMWATALWSFEVFEVAAIIAKCRIMDR